MNPKWHLSYARGYMELGLVSEAAAELECVQGCAREENDFLAVYAMLQQEKKNWRELEKTAEELCRRKPEDAGWWIMRAYGARRAVSIEKAETILLEAEKLHPSEATICFNLGCYACQQGKLITARERVDRAIKLDERFREAAESDPDLEPLRQKR